MATAISNHQQCMPCLSFRNKVENKLQQISAIALASLQSIVDFILFPARFIGAKDWSLPGVLIKTPYYICRKILGKDCNGFLGKSYHKNFEREVSPNEGKQYLPYMAAAAGSHEPKKFLNPLGLLLVNPQEQKLEIKDLVPFDSCLLDLSTGIKISIIIKNSSEVILAFGAKNSADHLFPTDLSLQKKIKRKQDDAITKNLLGLTPAAYLKTHEQLMQLLTCPLLKDKTITLTGSCFGGSLAQYLAMKLHLRAICFNSLQLGPGLQQDLGSDTLSQADDHVLNISVKRDFLNDNLLCNLASRALSFIGIKTPGNFGRQYFIPTAYNDLKKTHDFVLGSFMKHLGFSERTLPSDLPKEFFH